MFAQPLLHQLEELYRLHEKVEKSAAVQWLAKTLQLEAEGKLYVPQDRAYAVRFSYSAKGHFSNTVLALSKLLPLDHLPVLVCLLRPRQYELMLANTTFLHKISHSSHKLTETNIRGSFLGNDIAREYEGIANEPEQFDRLFTIHRAVPPEDNLRRLVDATSNITASKRRASIGAAERQAIHRSIRESFDPSIKPEMRRIQTKLDKRVDQRREEILGIARQDSSNVNLRGNRIEQIITKDVNQHGFDDIQFKLRDGRRVLIDIKTSLAGKSSNPKHYNVDKMLEALSDGRTLSYTYFVHINAVTEQINTFLIHSLDETILDHTRIQFHWAGRDSRGVTQLDAGISTLLSGKWEERPNVERALRYIDSLIAER